MADPLFGMSIGAAVLNALGLLLAGSLFIAALFLCRRKDDGARKVVRWLKAGLFFMAVFTFLELVYTALFAVFVNGSITSGAVAIVSTLAYTFMVIAKTVVFLAVTSLGRGILFARAGQRAKLSLLVAILTYVLLGLNTAMAVAYLGVYYWLNFGYDGGYSSYDDYDYEGILLHVNRLGFVPMIFLFAGSVASLAFSGLVFAKVHSKFPTLKSASIHYIVASFFFFVASLFEVIYNGLYTPLTLDALFTSRGSPNATFIVVFIFSTLPATLALVAIANLTRTKDNAKGLWTVKGGAAAFPPGVPQGQFQGQPMQPVPMGQPVQGQFVGYQPGVAQGVPQGQWQPQPGYYYPQQQQQQQQQFVPAQVPGQAPQQYGQYPVQAPSPVSQPTPPAEVPSQRQVSPPQEVSAHSQPHVTPA